MQFLIILVRLAVGAMALDVQVNEKPRHTLAERNETPNDQGLAEEVRVDCRRGIVPQNETAGRIGPGALELPEFRIVGGNEASPGQFPWQAAIVTGEGLFCGGSIISERWVLTAAHCVASTSFLTVILGAHNLDVRTTDKNRVTLKTKEIVVHSGFNDETTANDIALVHLPEAVKFNRYIKSIRLPSKRDVSNTFVGSYAIVSGWGTTKDGTTNISPTLQYVGQYIMENSKCASVYVQVQPTNICSDTTGGKSACSGDSGGPLIVKNFFGYVKQIGIVSFGARKGCALGYPIAYTRVTSYLEWISNHTGLFL